MNIGHEDDDLRPFVEPPPDFSDSTRMGKLSIISSLVCTPTWFCFVQQARIIHIFQSSWDCHPLFIKSHKFVIIILITRSLLYEMVFFFFFSYILGWNNWTYFISVIVRILLLMFDLIAFRIVAKDGIHEERNRRITYPEEVRRCDGLISTPWKDSYRYGMFIDCLLWSHTKANRTLLLKKLSAALKNTKMF